MRNNGLYTREEEISTCRKYDMIKQKVSTHSDQIEQLVSSYLLGMH